MGCGLREFRCGADFVDRRLSLGSSLAGHGSAELVLDLRARFADFLDCGVYGGDDADERVLELRRLLLDLRGEFVFAIRMDGSLAEGAET